MMSRIEESNQNLRAIDLCEYVCLTEISLSGLAVRVHLRLRLVGLTGA